MFQTFISLSDWMQKEHTFKIYKIEWREGKRQRQYNLDFLKKTKLKIH